MEINARLWWTLPGPARFLKDIVAQLGRSKSVLVALPQHAPGGLFDAVAALVRKDWGSPLRIKVDEPRLAPEMIVFRSFGIPEREFTPDIDALAGHPQTRGRLVWLDGMESDHWATWKKFLLEYSDACRRHVDGPITPLRFIVPLQGNLSGQLPQPEVFLAVQKWKNRVRRIDMKLYVSEVSEHHAASFSMKERTRRLAQEMIVELAGTDPRLATRLIEAPVESVWEPSGILLELAGQRQWNVSKDAWPDREEAWRNGIVDEIEGVAHFHSAFLALTHFAKSLDLMRRIWKAQVGVLLPEIEEYRSRMLDRLPQKSSRYTPSDNLKELSHLCWELKGRIAPNEWHLLEEHRLIRNELAHLRPATPAMLRAIGY